VPFFCNRRRRIDGPHSRLWRLIPQEFSSVAALDENDRFEYAGDAVYPFRIRRSECVDALDDERSELARLSDKPSNGLEPLTASLPWRIQATPYGQ